MTFFRFRFASDMRKEILCPSRLNKICRLTCATTILSLSCNNDQPFTLMRHHHVKLRFQFQFFHRKKIEPANEIFLQLMKLLTNKYMHHAHNPFCLLSAYSVQGFGNIQRVLQPHMQIIFFFFF